MFNLIEYIQKSTETRKRLRNRNQNAGDRVVYMQGDNLYEGTVVIRNGAPCVKLDSVRPYTNIYRFTRHEYSGPKFIKWHEGFIKF